MMKRLGLLCLIFWLALPPVFAANAAPAANIAGNSAQADSPPVIPNIVRRYSLKELSHQDALTLRSTDGIHTMDFGVRADEIVTRAVLHVRYTYSPALLPLQSHVKVKVNDEMVGVLPITKENAGQTVTADVEIDPRFISGFNKLKLQFIGHYTMECEDPLHSSLWVEISGTSELELTSRPILLKNELSILPEPFFDKRESKILKLPFVFAANPARSIQNAAGIVSSWFGELAAWRGARFPVNLNQLPQGHAVVFATNTEYPAFLEKHPKVSGPTLEMVTNPADGYSKLLLILGRDGNDLITASKALALGGAALSGPVASIAEFNNPEPRKAYDAPNWVRLDRPMKFGELVGSPQDLQVFGHVSAPIRINMTVPPDLFTWHSRGVPVDLKFRYTPPIKPGSESRMSMSINDELVESFNLRSSGQGGESARVRLPLLDDLLFGEDKEIFVPAFKLGTHNQLQYNFSFSFFKEGHCRDAMVENVRALVDADSKIDFSGFPHYAQLPNLDYFVSAGYPFTKYADLSQTVVVMPDAPSSYDIETMLTLLGRMGQATGYPATRVRIVDANDTAKLKDADLIVIGTAAGQKLLSSWAGSLPATLGSSIRHVSQPNRGVNFLYDWLGFDTDPDPTVFTQEKLNDKGALAAILGFESPLSSGRSVVAVTAVASSQLPLALDALDDAGMAHDIQGSVALIHPAKVESALVGATYYVGHLPFLTAIWYPLSKHPVLIAILAVLALLLFAFALSRTLRAIAAKRMKGEP